VIVAFTQLFVRREAFDSGEQTVAQWLRSVSW